jgi:hypothetical protein
MRNVLLCTLTAAVLAGLPLMAEAATVIGHDVFPAVADAEAVTFEPTQVWAWSEQRRGETFTVVYMSTHDLPAQAWLDSEDRQATIAAALLEAKAPYVRWDVDAELAPDAIMRCNPTGACAYAGINIINGLPSARSTLQAEGKRLSGKLEEGVGDCGGVWCEVRGGYEIDVDLAPPPLIERVVASGSTKHAAASAARMALSEYWNAAGKAQRSSDLSPYLSVERNAAAARQAGGNEEHVEKMFIKYFVPAHSGKLTIDEIKVLGNDAVASIRAPSDSGGETRDLACKVLLREQGGAWKVGPEKC